MTSIEMGTAVRRLVSRHVGTDVPLTLAIVALGVSIAAT